MVKGENTLTLKDFVIATGSPNRTRFLHRQIAQVLDQSRAIMAQENLSDLAKALERLASRDTIRVHALNPETHSNVPESIAPDTEQVAIDKVHVLLIALRIVTAGRTQNEHINQFLMHRKLREIDPQEHQLSLDEIGVWASDVGVFVEQAKDEDKLGGEDRPEFLKITRDLSDVKYWQNFLVIREKMREAIRLYCEGDFFVLYKVGFAFWHRGQLVSQEWEVKLKFGPLPEDIVKKAFLKKKDEKDEQRGVAFRSSARVDLATLAPEYARDMKVRLVSQNREPVINHEWKDVQIEAERQVAKELLELFILGGAMPATSMIMFMMGDGPDVDTLLGELRRGPVTQSLG